MDNDIFKFLMKTVIVTWLTIFDVFPDDLNMLVPVRPILFMVEAQGMEQLMLDDMVMNALRNIQRHCLVPTPTPDIWVTPETEQ